MTVRPIIQAPNTTLTAVCALVADDHPQADLAALVRDLRDTRAAAGGLGLAAPQIGRLLRVVAINPGRTIGYGFLINPEIVRHWGDIEWGDEGCLSIGGGKISSYVPRWASIELRFRTLAGEVRTAKAQGCAARIIQHEVDHLDGKLITDHRVRDIAR